jgi:lipopolysaccharide/colanic/teichoic acid biosynthesis glycosyltransferase
VAAAVDEITAEIPAFGLAQRPGFQSAHQPDVALDSPLLPVARSWKKRSIDVTVAVTGLVLLAPVLILIALVIVLDGGWPAVYVQQRVGLRGRLFRLWKFRTMVRGAEALRDSLTHLNEAPFPAFKLRDDPRVTRVGRLLRNSSLDELPQLWNVLKGEMSLVGPRPALPNEVCHYDTLALQRLEARPGITGIWQVEDRHRKAGHFGDWVRADIKYLEEWSVWQDLVLLGKTIIVVTRMTGH